MSRSKAKHHPTPPARIEITADELHSIVERTKHGRLSDEDYSKLKRVIETFLWLLQVIEKTKLKMSDLQRQLFGSKSEKKSDVLSKGNGQGKPDPDDKGSDSPGPKPKQKQKRKGHGRNGADSYTGATRHKCHHETLEVGAVCPSCGQGKLYAIAPSSVVVVTGQPPLAADRYDCDRLRCNLCGDVFTAELPQEAKRPKYDETCASTIAILKYGSGLPFHRIEKLERAQGIPLPASTQWEIVLRAVVLVFGVIYTELIRQAAQCKIVYNDDTKARILSHASRVAGEPTDSESSDAPPGRNGTFTTGIVAHGRVGKIALYLTGWRHAGENLRRVLEERAAELAPPIQMCDGLDRNVPKALATVLANCLVHGRRHFVKLVDNFPREVRFVIQALARVYVVDADARERGLSPGQRLELHQEKSALIMARLAKWMKLRLELKKTEPNSSLGQAIQYMQKRWDRLTLFLRVPGAPLDSNEVERVLKTVVLHRKNSMFYKTDTGARVGDTYMSLIRTCELQGVSPFDYLTELQRNAKRVVRAPGQWMPWNYREAVAAAAASTAA